MRIGLSAARSAAGIEIAVVDDGPGVDEGMGSRLFERFARSEQSRSTPGHGLGLSLVRAIARAHGGQAELRHRQPGFGVTLRFPVGPD